MKSSSSCSGAVRASRTLDLERQQLGDLQVGRVRDRATGHVAMVRPRQSRGRMRTISTAASSSPTTSASCRIETVPAQVVAGPSSTVCSPCVARNRPRRMRWCSSPACECIARPGHPAGRSTSMIVTSRDDRPSTCSIRPRSPWATGRSRADDRRGRDVAHEEPGRRDVEYVGDLAQHGQRGRRLVVLDLRQVADVEATPRCDLGQGQPADARQRRICEPTARRVLLSSVARVAGAMLVCPHQYGIDISITSDYGCGSNDTAEARESRSEWRIMR